MGIGREPYLVSTSRNAIRIAIDCAIIRPDAGEAKRCSQTREGRMVAQPPAAHPRRLLRDLLPVRLAQS